jgi:hypothetical protein
MSIKWNISLAQVKHRDVLRRQEACVSMGISLSMLKRVIRGGDAYREAGAQGLDPQGELGYLVTCP